MSSGLFKNDVTVKVFNLQIIYIYIYIYKQDPALDNL